MTNRAFKLSAALVSAGLLTAACGERPVDRALTGGAIGAASGAVVGSTVGAGHRRADRRSNDGTAGSADRAACQSPVDRTFAARGGQQPR